MPLLNANGRADLQTSRVFRRKRKAVCLLVIILGLVTGASEKATCQEPTTAADQKSELEEAERLSQKAKNLSREYEYGQAILLADRALAIRENVLGPYHPLVANSLNSLADLYRSNGSDERAEPLYQRALAIREKALGPDHPDVAASLNRLAKLYIGKRDYVRAEPLLYRAIAIAEKVLGVQHPTVALYLNNLALLYSDSKLEQRADLSLERSFAILEKAPIADYLDNAQEIAQSLKTLANRYEGKGDRVRLEKLLQRGIPIFEKLPGFKLYVVTSLKTLAELYWSNGDLVRAEPLLQRALVIFETEAGSDDPELILFLQQLATLYVAKGDYVRAEPLLQRGLAIFEKRPDAEADIAASLNTLAALYMNKGDLDRAEPLLDRAVRIREKIGVSMSLASADIVDLPKALTRLANLYASKGEFARAEALLQRALAIRQKEAGADHSDVAGSLNNLALLYYQKGDLVKAESFFERAIAIQEKLFPAEHREIAVTLFNLANVYLDKGEFTRAEALVQRALAIREKELGAEDPELAIYLNGLGALYKAEGDFARAEPAFHRSLAILEKTLGNYHPNVANLLSKLALMYEAKGDTARAIQLRTSGNEIREHNLTLILSAGSEEQKRLYMSTFSYETDYTISLHTRSSPSSVESARLALTTILRRKGRALDAMTDQIGSLRRHLEPQDRKLLDELSAARAQLSNLVLTGPGNATPAEHQTAVDKLKAEVERLEAAISSRSVEFSGQAQTVTLEKVQNAIPAGAALVEFVSYKPFDAKRLKYEAARYAAYILRSRGMPQWVDLGEAAAIDRGVANFRSALTKPASPNVKQAARALDEKMMRPIRKLLFDTNQIFISPDGALNLIPFGALVDEQNRYLVETYSITYLTSGRDLLRLQVHSESRQSPLVMANPKFNIPDATGHQTAVYSDGTKRRRSLDFSELHFGPLEGTAGEAQALRSLLPGVRVLTGAEATEATLKQVSGPSILHIATHGFFLPDQVQASGESASKRGLEIMTLTQPQSEGGENPLLRSGLALAGVNQRQSGAGEDGVLTALEAAGLDLWGTKLVVLSACETGLGEVKNGEGVYGLRRALVLAGSESQMMSLWQVSDDATRELMVSFYKRLQAGEGTTEALRQVQLEMLQSTMLSRSGQKRGLGIGTGGMETKKNWRHPFYWASFIQSGEWRSLDGANGLR